MSPLAAVREPASPVDVALRRDEAGDRTEERNRSGILDALRGVAALMVLADHTHWLSVGPHPGTLATAIDQMLAAGIYLFFAVSGYLIAGPFLRALVRGDPLPKAGPYFVRRAARIYPAYLIAFAVGILLAPAPHVQAYQMPVHLLLLQSVWPHAAESTALFPVAWTLGIEIAFYVFVPLAAAALRALHPSPWRPGRLALGVIAAGAASVAWTYFARRHFGGSPSLGSQIAQDGLQVWLGAFCPGMLVALAALGNPMTPAWRRFRWLMARPWLGFSLAAGLWASGYAMEHYGSPGLVVLSPSAYYVACALVLGCSVAAGGWITWPVRVLAPIGLVSYGIYLWHAIVIKFLYNHTSLGLHGVGPAWLLDSLFVLALTLPFAALSWFAVERPLMQRAAGWAKTRTRPRGEPALVRAAVH